MPYTKLYLKIFTILILLHFVSSTKAQIQDDRTLNAISRWLSSKELANAGISISVVNNADNKILYQTEPQISLVPASIMKVVTTATALEVFGSDYRFKTTLSYSGTIRNDTLFGNLQIIGGGDPTLGSMYFTEAKYFQEEWIKAIQKSNIKVIAGNIVVDATLYERQMVPGSWVWEDLGNYYGAGASGISVYDNLYEIHLKSPVLPDQQTTISKIIPEIPELELQNEVRSSDINSDQAYVFGNPEDNRRVIRGTIPKGKDDFVVKASMPNPPALIANEFRKKLSTNGISVSGKTDFEKITSSSFVLHETVSPSLREIIKVTNYESVNLFAEHLLKHLAWQKTGLGTTKEGCKFIIGFWKDKGLNMSGFFANDGSGLSRFNALTASHLTSILNYMATKSKNSYVFYQSLPASGEGTLSIFSPESFPNGSLRAKSGSMTRVRCYAGYLKTSSGKNLSFTVMLNNFSCTQSVAVRKIQELLMVLKTQ